MYKDDKNIRRRARLIISYKQVNSGLNLMNHAHY